MRGNDDVGQFEEGIGGAPYALFRGFLLEVVQCRAGDPAFGEGLLERRIFHDGSARGVDEDGGRLHPAQSRAVEGVVCLRGERCLDYHVVGTFHQVVERHRPHLGFSDVGLVEEWVMCPDLDTERLCAFGDEPCDRAEGQQAQHLNPQSVDGFSGLPVPFAQSGRPVVPADLAGGRKPERDGMIGDLFGTPIVRCVRDLDSVSGRGVDIDDIHAGAVAGDHPAAGQRADGARPHPCVLGEDAAGLSAHLDHLVLALALRRKELESGALDDCAFDIHIAEVVIRYQDRFAGVSASHGGSPSYGRGPGMTRRTPGSLRCPVDRPWNGRSPAMVSGAPVPVVCSRPTARRSPRPSRGGRRARCPGRYGSDHRCAGWQGSRRPRPRGWR